MTEHKYKSFEDLVPKTTLKPLDMQHPEDFETYRNELHRMLLSIFNSNIQMNILIL